MIYAKKFFKKIKLRESDTCLMEFMFYMAAPVLKQSKPAVLVNISSRYEKTRNNWENICDTLYTVGGLCVKTLCTDGECRRVLIYDYAMLSKTLNSENVAPILRRMDYGDNLEIQLETLSCRYQPDNISQNSFPHEIGLFLGYPPEDVEGFIKNKGAESLLCGAWKVYGDVNYAKRKWNEWHNAKERMAALLTNGIPCQAAVKLI